MYQLLVFIKYLEKGITYTILPVFSRNVKISKENLKTVKPTLNNNCSGFSDLV
ncbi:MAG: hypothetical protein JWM14_1343 [Chitinophagaceae bacterium]|nr:hypothetical protein [Chitinophagaceae bacterium]